MKQNKNPLSGSYKAMKTTSKKMQWRVNTGGLLKEIAQCSPDAAILRIPLKIFSDLLYEVGGRAAELNDPKLNQLMARLSIYAETDPYNPAYDEKLTHKILNTKV